MSVFYDSTGRPASDTTAVTVTLGQAGLGGSIGARLIVDDAVLTSKEQVLLALETITMEVMQQSWPAA